MDLGKKIKTARVKKGLSQEKLARDCEISLSQMYKIERGTIRNPSFEIVAKIADILDLSLDSLR